MSLWAALVVATIALKHFMDEGTKVFLVDVDEEVFLTVAGS